MILILTSLVAINNDDIYSECNQSLYDCYSVVIGATDDRIDPYGPDRETRFNLTVKVLLDDGSVATSGKLRIITSNRNSFYANSTDFNITREQTKFKLKYGAYTTYWISDGKQVRLEPKLYATAEENNGTVQTLKP